MARISINTVDENMELLSTAFKNEIGQDINIDKTSEWYMLMFPIAYLTSLTEQKMQDLADKMNIFKCVGTDLDDILNGNFSFPRKQSSKSKVLIKITGVQGTVINMNDITVETFDKTEYTVIGQGEIGTNGSIDLLFECLESGDIGNRDLGSITKLKKTKTGIFSIEQLEDATGGDNAENDNEYLQRWFISRNDSFWNVDGIYSSVLEVAGVEACYVDENDTMEVNDKGLPPKSIVVVADGGRNEDIAKAIWDKLDYSIMTVGDVSVKIKDVQGIERTINFFRPKEVEIEYKIEKQGDVELYKLNGSVKEYLNSKKIGATLTSYACETDFIRRVYNSDVLLDFEVYFRRKGEVEFSKILNLGFNEKPIGVFYGG